MNNPHIFRYFKTFMYKYIKKYKYSNKTKKQESSRR